MEGIEVLNIGHLNGKGVLSAKKDVHVRGRKQKLRGEWEGPKAKSHVDVIIAGRLDVLHSTLVTFSAKLVWGELSFFKIFCKKSKQRQRTDFFVCSK